MPCIARALALPTLAVALILSAVPASPAPAADRASQAWVRAAIRTIRHRIVRPPADAFPSSAATVTVRFTVDRAGRVLDAAIGETSGSPRLDRAALDAVIAASPLPALTWSRRGAQTFLVLIRFVRQ